MPYQEPQAISRATKASSWPSLMATCWAMTCAPPRTHCGGTQWVRDAPVSMRSTQPLVEETVCLTGVRVEASWPLSSRRIP